VPVPTPIIAKKLTKDSGALNASAWIDAAFLVLARNGIEAVRVERLATTLKVTKGSFYWHFTDRPALLDAMLSTWRKRATLDIIERIERTSVEPGDRLRQLIALPLTGSRSMRGADVEAAIRLWARSDSRTASAVREIDRRRLDYIKSLLHASGVAAAEIAARATLIYAFMLAEAAIGPAIDADAHRQCEKLLLGH
jgi:AcrR family transcriptional regulator